MNKKLIVIAGLSVLAFSLAFAGVAMAQTPTPPAPGNGYGYGPGWMMGGYGYGMMRGGFGRRGFGMMGGFGAYGPMHDAMFNALAEGLGLTRSELDARIAAGETPAQIAASQGLSRDEFVRVFTEARKSAIEQAVKDGYLTQVQADWMLNHMGNFGAGVCPHFGTQTNP